MSDQTPPVQITLTLDELKALIHDAVREALVEVLGEDLNPEPNFSPEIAARLQRYKDQKPERISIEDAIRELDLDD